MNLSIVITDARKQLGRCPQCGNESVKLTELHERGMCADCYITVLRKAFHILAEKYVMDGLIIQEAIRMGGDALKDKEIKVYYPASAAELEAKEMLDEYIQKILQGEE